MQNENKCKEKINHNGFEQPYVQKNQGFIVNSCYFTLQASKDFLLQFSRDYLAGEGDITRHLSYLGYKVTYTQTALDEFDFAVTKLAVDLRDGLRLA